MNFFKLRKERTYLEFLLVWSNIIDPRGDYQIFFSQILNINLIFVIFIVSFEPINFAYRLLLFLEMLSCWSPCVWISRIDTSFVKLAEARCKKQIFFFKLWNFILFEQGELFLSHLHCFRVRIVEPVQAKNLEVLFK